MKFIFHLTGKEPTDGYLTIKDLECKYTEGIHPNPKTTIKSDSRLWLAISNNEVSGDQAYIKKEYKADGDMTLLLKLSDLFSSCSLWKLCQMGKLHRKNSRSKRITSGNHWPEKRHILKAFPNWNTAMASDILSAPERGGAR